VILQVIVNPKTTACTDIGKSACEEARLRSPVPLLSHALATKRAACLLADHIILGLSVARLLFGQSNRVTGDQETSEFPGKSPKVPVHLRRRSCNPMTGCCPLDRCAQMQIPSGELSPHSLEVLLSQSKLPQRQTAALADLPINKCHLWTLKEDSQCTLQQQERLRRMQTHSLARMYKLHTLGIRTTQAVPSSIYRA
jgi:hypothetical protein